MGGASTEGTGGRSQFVLMIMVMLGVGLVASLWLSTTAAADSYRLDSARAATRDLSERGETLRTQIASMQSAPALAQAAQALGMVQVSDVAKLVVERDGSITVVGTPKAAAPVPALATPAAPQPPTGPASPSGGVPGRGADTPVPAAPGPVPDQIGSEQATDRQSEREQTASPQQPAPRQVPRAATPSLARQAARPQQAQAQPQQAQAQPVGQAVGLAGVGAAGQQHPTPSGAGR